LFSTFPGGWPGVGLLLLRSAVGVASALQGAHCLAGGGDSASQWLVGAAALLTGGSLLAGLLAPLSGGLVAAGSAGYAAGWIPDAVPGLFDATVPAIFVAIVAIAVAFLGPGAYSVDARLFGRREIIIPPPTRAGGA
jgi:hypothetical protein